MAGDTAARVGPFWDVMEGRAEAPPAAVTLGFRLVDIDPDAGTITTSFEASDGFLNPFGMIQGGFLAAMLDDTLGPALVATLEPGQHAPTTDLHVQFLRPAQPGSAHRARAHHPARAGHRVHDGRAARRVGGGDRDRDGNRPDPPRRVGARLLRCASREGCSAPSCSTSPPTGVTADVVELDDDRLPDGDVSVDVEWSSLNYKDGLILKGLGRLVRDYPHVPGHRPGRHGDRVRGPALRRGRPSRADRLAGRRGLVGRLRRPRPASRATG